MAVRAIEIKLHAIIVAKKVSTLATQGVGAKFGAADDEATNAAAGESTFGVFEKSGVPGDIVGVLTPFVAITKVKVAAGGTATRGSWAEASTAGFTNRALGGGTVARNIAGMFLQSGVAGDEVSLGVFSFVGVSA